MVHFVCQPLATFWHARKLSPIRPRKFEKGDCSRTACSPKTRFWDVWLLDEPIRFASDLIEPVQVPRFFWLVLPTCTPTTCKGKWKCWGRRSNMKLNHLVFTVFFWQLALGKRAICTAWRHGRNLPELSDNLPNKLVSDLMSNRTAISEQKNFRDRNSP